nr:3-isopropylmalate dehydratase large subunit, chloroplastic-like [Tanacetum cinerariifolium]
MVSQVPLLISFNVEEVRKQVAASTQTFKEGNMNVHILRNFAKEQNIKYFYDITDHRDFMANPEYKGVCHIANAQEGYCKPREVGINNSDHKLDKFFRQR